MTVEKRRYFRITDAIGLSFRLIRPQTPELKLSTADMEDTEKLKMIEGELATLTNTLWENDPKIARAIGLLNQKVEILAGKNRLTHEEIMEQFDHYYPDIEVNLSASGIAFVSRVEFSVNDRLEMMLQLKSSRTNLNLKGTVINVDDQDSKTDGVFLTCIEFDIEAQEKEQLIQHIARRQVELLSKKNEAI